MTNTRLMNIPPEEIEAGRGMAIIAHFIFFVPLLVEDARKNRFAMYHTEQALALLLPSILCPPVGIIGLIGQIIGAIHASNGKLFETPVVGQFGEKFNFVRNAEAAQLKG